MHHLTALIGMLAKGGPVLDTTIPLSPLLGVLGTETPRESSRTRTRGRGFTPP